MGARTAIGLMRLDPGRFRSLTISGSNAGCVDDRLRERKAELATLGVTAGTLLQRAAARGLPGARAGAVAPLPPDPVDQPAAPA